MSYQVLARKWRPRRFEDMVGQPHVLKALVNALDQNRLHHAYLFTGTRGVGKTTVARILAKALNCERGVSATPCGECAACQEIDQGRFVDLIEVDAASRTKVDETRELLENVQYAPSRGRYKVYLIDEVHMFSNHSFNALLKTLEEPPPHVKFLLATTDPKRLPITILSRCLQFNLKRLAPEPIAEYLAGILDQEGIDHDPASLRLIAAAADGSLRDALSLLDQAIAFGGGALRRDEVAAMLGTIDRRQVLRLLERLVEGDGRGLLEAVASLDESAPDHGEVLADLLTLLQRIAIRQALPDLGDEDPDFGDAVADLAGRLSPEACQLFYQIALLGRRDLPLAPDPRAGLEMVLLRMLAFQPEAAEPVPDASSSTAGTTGRTAVAPGGVEAAPVQAGPSPAPTGRLPNATETQAPAPVADARDWPALIEAMGLAGLVRELAGNCVLRSIGEQRVELVLAAQYKQLRSPNVEARLEQQLREHFGRPLRLVLKVEDLGDQETPVAARSREQEERLRAAAEAIDSDPNVQALRQAFDAEVDASSIRPL